jgi:TolB-like protein
VAGQLRGRSEPDGFGFGAPQGTGRETRREAVHRHHTQKSGYRFTADVTAVEGPEARQAAEGMSRGDSVAEVGSSEGVVASKPVDQVLSQVSDDGRTLNATVTQRKDRLGLGVPAATKGKSWISSWRASLLVVACLVASIVATVSFLRWKTLRPPSTAPRRLAVLPFQNLRHDPGSDFLGFSLTDDIINRLGYVSELTIRPSYAVQKYRNEVPDLQQVASTLRVDTLLTGNFIREGENLRVSYQLVDVRSNRILRQGTIDLKYENLLAVQDDVSAQVIAAMALTLSPSEARELKNEPPIPPRAYEYYLRGVDLYSRNDFLMAIEMLRKSAEIYPGYALTWAHLGRTYTASASFQFGGAELYRKAQAAYERALALQPTLLSARIYMANLLTDTGRPEQAVPLLRETLVENPNLAEAHWELGYAYRYGGMLEDSIKECQRARELDPVVKLTTSAMNAYLYLGEYDTFLRSLPPSNGSAFVEFYRGFALYNMHQWDGAAEALDHAYEIDPTMLQAQVGKALSYRIHHQNSQGLALLNAAERKIRQRGVGDPEAMYKLAEAYSELGDTASALSMFRHSVESGFFPYPYFARDPLMDPIRQQSEFQKALQIARQRSEVFKSRFF